MEIPQICTNDGGAAGAGSGGGGGGDGGDGGSFQGSLKLVTGLNRSNLRVLSGPRIDRWQFCWLMLAAARHPRDHFQLMTRLRPCHQWVNNSNRVQDQSNGPRIRKIRNTNPQIQRCLKTIESTLRGVINISSWTVEQSSVLTETG